MRSALGDGYVEALRQAYRKIPRGADLVMFWWYRAGQAVGDGRTTRAGLITTNSIVQSRNRKVIEHIAEQGAHVRWAVPDHPWEVGPEGAAVRVAMTVIDSEPREAVRVDVDESGRIERELKVPRLNSDLTADADVASASSVALRSNAGMSSRGFLLRGRGFVLPHAEALTLINSAPSMAEIVRPLISSRDVVGRDRGLHVIDFASRTEAEARQWPLAFDLIRARVKPERMGKKEENARTFWWRFWRTRDDLRDALAGQVRFIARPYVAKHSAFVFADIRFAPDDNMVAIALADGFHMGVLSSSVHETWSLAAGGRVGVGNDPSYNNSMCFDPFPFPCPQDHLREDIAEVAERLDAHRMAAIGRDERVTLTLMYNVVEKLRLGEALNPTERHIHDIAACGTLRDLHDELDTLVAQAYGWPWPMEREEILSRLVDLHAERVEEEKQGTVRWLRPEYQIPRFAPEEAEGGSLALSEAEPIPTGAESAKSDVVEWPADTIEQLGALRTALAEGPLTPAEAAKRFRGARRDVVTRHLEALDTIGTVSRENGKYHLVEASA
jgi:hypothetical protein